MHFIKINIDKCKSFLTLTMEEFKSVTIINGGRDAALLIYVARRAYGYASVIQKPFIDVRSFRSRYQPNTISCFPKPLCIQHLPFSLSLLLYLFFFVINNIRMIWEKIPLSQIILYMPMNSDTYYMVLLYKLHEALFAEWL